MTISWYPGHMYKAKKEMIKTMTSTDVLIEVLDARSPQASSNPLLEEIRGKVPCLKILNKADLADPQTTESWHRHFSKRKDSLCIVNGKDKQIEKKDILKLCKQLIPKDSYQFQKQYHIMIAGIPNVGKSTLLNNILSRKVANTGNEPAITKGQQRVRLENNWYLVDTPGLLWPKLEDQEAAYRLAFMGTIRNTAIEAEDIAWFGAEYLLENHYAAIEKRYRLEQRPADAEQLLTAIAKFRACVGKKGRVDWHKTAEVLLNDYRSGKLGRMSLEPAPSSS